MTKSSDHNKHKIPTLAKRRDFLRIAATRKKWVAPGMIVQMAEGTEDRSAIRVGYTASKKVGNAVRRNRAKRRLREVVRKSLWDRGVRGHDYVLIARSATVDMSFDQLIRDFNWCLKRLKPSNARELSAETADQAPGTGDKA
ncbi:MAG TPA: ribonuclease P protein component [Sphingomonadales bacterium]|nr:ribonuclease P protein component [Sphingomonadales bacterium]